MGRLLEWQARHQACQGRSTALEGTSNAGQIHLPTDEVAPLKVRRTEFTPTTFRPEALSVTGYGVGAAVGADFYYLTGN